MAKKKVNEGGKITTRDINAPEQWEQTRTLYAQLCVMSVAQQLLLKRVDERMRMHGLYLKQEQKQYINRSRKMLEEASKWLDRMEMFSSTLGKNGMEDFCKMNQALNVEGYELIRLWLSWQNATHVDGGFGKKIEEYVNSLSTGKKRYFTKKLIDTFRLEEDK